ALDAACAPGVVRLEDHLGVAFGEEAVALLLKCAAQAAEIVDAAVEHDREAERRIEHRLLAGRLEIENAQPPMAERDGALREEPGGIRPARRERPGHSLDCREIGSAPIKSDVTA